MADREYVVTQFGWDQTDILEYLEVVPEIDEYGVEYRYVVEQPPLRLVLFVLLSSTVYITISCDGVDVSIIDVEIRDCSGARVVNNERGNYIEFAAGNLFSKKYDGASVIPYGLRLYVRPSIRAEFFSV